MTGLSAFPRQLDLVQFNSTRLSPPSVQVLSRSPRPVQRAAKASLGTASFIATKTRTLRSRGVYRATGLTAQTHNNQRMADNKQGPATGPSPTLAEYKKSQAKVRELVEKRRVLEKRLNQVEESILSKEASYLESTPSGNIITGFDNYMKGTGGAASQRRKSGPADLNRVFSKSSISYRPNNGDSTPGSTPASHTPTPVSASFRENGNPSSAAGTKSKPKKKSAPVADKEVEDSEHDGTAGKKRTNFGATRK